MHQTVQNLISIQSSINSKLLELKEKNRIPKIIAVSKTFKIDHIMPLIDYGHLDFGENKVQEAVEKWKDIKKINDKIKLHLIGKLQSNKVKTAVKIFDYIHSLDSEKLAKKISEEQKKNNLRPKIFIQINLGEESQKSGIMKNQLQELIIYSKEIGLQIVGLMCMPPANTDPSEYFKLTDSLNRKFGFKELSMGMSSDYLIACEYSSSFLRIGSDIFGKRS